MAAQLPETAQPWQMISFRFSRASSSSKLSPAFELPYIGPGSSSRLFLRLEIRCFGIGDGGSAAGG